MPFPIYVIVTLIIVGVLLWAAKALLGRFIDAAILNIINNVVLVCVVLWLLVIFLSWIGYLPGNYHVWPGAIR